MKNLVITTNFFVIFWYICIESTADALSVSSPCSQSIACRQCFQAVRVPLPWAGCRLHRRWKNRRGYCRPANKVAHQLAVPLWIEAAWDRKGGSPLGIESLRVSAEPPNSPVPFGVFEARWPKGRRCTGRSPETRVWCHFHSLQGNPWARLCPKQRRSIAPENMSYFSSVRR